MIARMAQIKPTPPLAPPLDQFRRHKSVVVLLLTMVFFKMCLSHIVVENLPGFPGKLPFNLQTGYIGVGEREEVQLFYYFIESESNPEKDPLVLWLTGGPGCSGLSGLFYEIGPLTIDYANSNGIIPSLMLNEYSWTKVTNLIFLDQPVGTGFSYATTSAAYYSSDTGSAKLTYDFLRKWLINNPKYLKNPLYISGDSYSGIILPQVVDILYKGIELGTEPVINMKGYTLGNPITDLDGVLNGQIKYAHRMGLLSNRLYQSAEVFCHGDYIEVDPENILCQNVLEKINKCIEKIRLDQILENWCVYFNIPRTLLQSSVATTTRSWCRDDNYAFLNKWANIKSVQKALRIREGTIKEWSRCNKTISDGTTYAYDVSSTIGYHRNLTHKSCRALIYSGDHDMYVPHTSTEEWIDSVNLSIQSDWRPWFVDDQVAGYTMTYELGAYELTYATVKGAGHTAAEYKPIQCLAMIRSWFCGSSL